MVRDVYLYIHSYFNDFLLAGTTRHTYIKTKYSTFHEFLSSPAYAAKHVNSFSKDYRDMNVGAGDLMLSQANLRASFCVLVSRIAEGADGRVCTTPGANTKSSSKLLRLDYSPTLDMHTFTRISQLNADDIIYVTNAHDRLTREASKLGCL